MMCVCVCVCVCVFLHIIANERTMGIKNNYIYIVGQDKNLAYNQKVMGSNRNTHMVQHVAYLAMVWDLGNVITTFMQHLQHRY